MDSSLIMSSHRMTGSGFRYYPHIKSTSFFCRTMVTTCKQGLRLATHANTKNKWHHLRSKEKNSRYYWYENTMDGNGCSTMENFTTAEALKDQRNTFHGLSSWWHHIPLYWPACVVCVIFYFYLAAFYHCGFPHMYIYCISIWRSAYIVIMHPGLQWISLTRLSKTRSILASC